MPGCSFKLIAMNTRPGRKIYHTANIGSSSPSFRVKIKMFETKPPCNSIREGGIPIYTLVTSLVSWVGMMRRYKLKFSLTLCCWMVSYYYYLVIFATIYEQKTTAIIDFQPGVWHFHSPPKWFSLHLGGIQKNCFFVERIQFWANQPAVWPVPKGSE